MVTHKKATLILKNWGLENEKLSDIYYDGSGNRNENAFYVGTDYVLKFSAHLGKLKSHITISKALKSVGLFAATPVETLDGKEKYQELYKTNKMMTEWLVSVFNELRDNCLVDGIKKGI